MDIPNIDANIPNINTGFIKFILLAPIDLIAINSESDDNLLKDISIDKRQASGIVITNNDGIKYIMVSTIRYAGTFFAKNKSANVTNFSNNSNIIKRILPKINTGITSLIIYF